MKRLLLALPVLVLLAGFAVSCGGEDEEPADLRPILDTLPVFPGSAIDGPNDGANGPALLVEGEIESFRNSRRMFIASATTTKEQVLDFYRAEIPKLGWEAEDPPDPNTDEMVAYCAPAPPITVEGTPVEQADLITCMSYTKDDVRLIVSAPIQLQLNPISTQGVSFHLFLEEA